VADAAPTVQTGSALKQRRTKRRRSNGRALAGLGRVWALAAVSALAAAGSALAALRTARLTARR
jgi:hypothetical protein